MSKVPPRALISIVAAALAIGCLDPYGPAVAEVSAVVYGRIRTTSGTVVPGADAIVELLSDTIRRPGYQPECAGGRVLAAVTQPLDASGDYRVVLSGRGPVGVRVCVQVTGDPHGIYSDVGLVRAYGGWLELRSGATARDSLRVDARYLEMP